MEFVWVSKDSQGIELGYLRVLSKKCCLEIMIDNSETICLLLLLGIIIDLLITEGYFILLFALYLFVFLPWMSLCVRDILPTQQLNINNMKNNTMFNVKGYNNYVVYSMTHMKGEDNEQIVLARL